MQIVTKIGMKLPVLILYAKVEWELISNNGITKVIKQTPCDADVIRS